MGNEDEVATLIELARKLEGPDAQRRQARRRRGDRADAVAGLRPAVLRRGRRQRGHAVRQGRRRKGRPGQVRLPRPAHADHHRLGGEGDQRSARGERRSAARHHPAADGRRRDLRAAGARRHHRGVPVRIARHEGLHPEAAAAGLRRHRRAGGAVPAGPARRRHGRRLHRPPPRPRRSQLPAPAPGSDAEADLRRHRLPGAGDADRPDAGRLHARRRRPAAPRDGQEGRRRDGAAARAIFEIGAADNGVDPGDAALDLRPDGEVRRLRFQQVALGGLRPDRLPDRMAEGALSGRVHGRDPVFGHGQHRQAGRLPRRRPRGLRDRSAAARYQRIDLPVRGARRQTHPLRTRRDQGRRSRRLRGDRGRTQQPRPLRNARRSRATGRWQPSEQARARSPGALRCTRRFR